MTRVRVERSLKTLERHRLKADLSTIPDVIIYNENIPGADKAAIKALNKKYPLLAHGVIISMPDNGRDTDAEEIAALKKYGYWFEGM